MSRGAAGRLHAPVDNFLAAVSDGYGRPHVVAAPSERGGRPVDGGAGLRGMRIRWVDAGCARRCRTAVSRFDDGAITGISCNQRTTIVRTGSDPWPHAVQILGG